MLDKLEAIQVRFLEVQTDLSNPDDHVGYAQIQRAE